MATTVSLSTLNRLPALPTRPSVERLRATLAENAEPKPDKQHRAGRRREVIPASPEAVEHARRLAVKRAKLERELEKVHEGRLQSIADLRAQGVSLTELADIMGVTKARVQQLVKEAADKGYKPKP